MFPIYLIKLIEINRLKQLYEINNTWFTLNSKYFQINIFTDKKFFSKISKNLEIVSMKRVFFLDARKKVRIFNLAETWQAFSITNECSY